MDEIELDQIIMFLRGNLTLKQLLKNVEIRGFGRVRNHLRFSLEQLIDIQKNEEIGLKFRRNFGRGKKRDLYRQQIKEGIKTLDEFKKILPHMTYYRLKKDMIN